MRWRGSRRSIPTTPRPRRSTRSRSPGPPIPRTRRTRDLKKAGAILEPLWQTLPDHPGLAHYIIHSYDVPALASRAVTAARRYAKIAPAAPHALHMPSHTFTRLGYWQESIDTNILSAEAARTAGSVYEELHALDYQAYAYLQSGQDAAAGKLVQTSAEVGARRNDNVLRRRGSSGRRHVCPRRDPGALRARTRRLGRGGARWKRRPARSRTPTR